MGPNACPEPAPDHVAVLVDVTVCCYDDAVPARAAAAIEQLYGHLLCSSSNFEVARMCGTQALASRIAHRGRTPIAIFLFNDKRNIVTVISEFIDLARHCGIVGVATIDGHVCGSAIGFRIGMNHFMHVVAHDPAHNGYSLGILCYYCTMCAGIEQGDRRFHLLPGRYEYKYRLLGTLQGIPRRSELSAPRRPARAPIIGISKWNFPIHAAFLTPFENTGAGACARPTLNEIA